MSKHSDPIGVRRIVVGVVSWVVFGLAWWLVLRRDPSSWLPDLAGPVVSLLFRVRVIGAEPALTPKYFQSRINGERTSLPLKNTIADGVRISVPGHNPWPIIEKYVDEIVLVEDEHIVAGMRALAKDAKLVAEPAASIGIGALLAGAVKVRPDEKVCAVLSGGNWDLADLAGVYQGGD